MEGKVMQYALHESRSGKSTHISKISNHVIHSRSVGVLPTPEMLCQVPISAHCHHVLEVFHNVLLSLGSHMMICNCPRVEKWRVQHSDSRSKSNLHAVSPHQSLCVQYLSNTALICSFTNCCADSFNYKFMCS